MKETFLEIIRVPDRGSMVRSLRAWIDWVIDSGPPELVRRARRFLEKMEHIVAWTMHPVSNSVSEGVNKNIQDIRRQGYGYRNLKAFFDMILLRQGDLTYRF
jgi:Transposase and inactivated derivatives